MGRGKKHGRPAALPMPQAVLADGRILHPSGPGGAADDGIRLVSMGTSQRIALGAVLKSITDLINNRNEVLMEIAQGAKLDGPWEPIDISIDRSAVTFRRVERQGAPSAPAAPAPPPAPPAKEEPCSPPAA